MVKIGKGIRIYGDKGDDEVYDYLSTVQEDRLLKTLDSNPAQGKDVYQIFIDKERYCLLIKFSTNEPAGNLSLIAADSSVELYNFVKLTPVIITLDKDRKWVLDRIQDLDILSRSKVNEGDAKKLHEALLKIIGKDLTEVMLTGNVARVDMIKIFEKIGKSGNTEIWKLIEKTLPKNEGFKKALRHALEMKFKIDDMINEKKADK